MDLAHLRKEYTHSGLSCKELKENPADQFVAWFDQAKTAGILEPNAMSLATVSTEGNRPSLRTVLMKAFDKRGLVFFTHYQSRKGLELQNNPQAALLFTWLPLERQVSLSGTVQPLSREESEDYFAQRPRSSQISCWASPQSQVIRSRDEVIQSRDAIEKQFSGQPVPLPPNWGGYSLKPDYYEFWQGREGRLHDRFCYRHQAEEYCLIERLAP